MTKVPQQEYSRLLERLKQDPVFKTIPIQGLIHNVLKRLSGADLYVDAWPNFSAVVCEILHPNLYDIGSLLCHASSASALCDVLLDGDFTKKGKRTVMDVDYELYKELVVCMKGRLKLDLWKTIRPFYLTDHTAFKKCHKCPDGYRIGILEPQHADLVASKWSYSNSPEQVSKWMEERIRRYSTAAAFTKEDPSQPVAWVLKYHNGMIGPMYTLEEYRKKGLGQAVLSSLCQACFENAPQVPLYCAAVVGTEANIASIVASLGFVTSPELLCIFHVKPP